MSLGGAAQRLERHVRCLPTVSYQGGSEDLCFEIDGEPKHVTLKIAGFSRRLVVSLPDRALDLLEIAALVYGADAAISRGGATQRHMGKDWCRIVRIDCAVREPGFWNRDTVTTSLEELLAFLTGDRFKFHFVQGHSRPLQSGWFDFGENEAWKADRVLMFSGGLDSFGGALEEIIDQGHRVALVSHFSSTKIAPVQQRLFRAITAAHGPDCARRLPMRIHSGHRHTAENTHRSRSFLFAVLGAITAQAFNLNRVSFHENGVVSLNLPPVGSVVGTRATRTTHPQILHSFTQLLGHVFEGGMRVDNPFFTRTKTEVLQTIRRLQMSDYVRFTASCADTHNRTKGQPHCGLCSQCIDRQFATLAAGMTTDDPAEAYTVELLTGVRRRTEHCEGALSYLRNALAFEAIDAETLVQNFPDVTAAINHLDCLPDAGLHLITDLLRRHGSAIAGAMRDVARHRPSASFPDGSLPRMFGQVVQAGALNLPAVPHPKTSQPDPEPVLLEYDPDKRSVKLAGCIAIRANATNALLVELSKEYLSAAGQGLDPFDYPCLSARKLARQLGLESDENLRRRLSRSRSFLKRQFISAGLEPVEIIENLRGAGYRINPITVLVRRHSNS